MPQLARIALTRRRASAAMRVDEAVTRIRLPIGMTRWRRAHDVRRV